MRYLIFIFIMSLIPALSSAQDSDSARFSFDKVKHDFGDIFQGKTSETVFSFTNTGKLPLIISNIFTTCGCTAPTWPREPVPPNGKGEIKIAFNSTGKIGIQNKVVTIMSDAAGGPFYLKISANILPSKLN
ncbi:MAG TPA: DUF1573 domain-containing protein [Cyclobacteriaceae bacterium]|nr:DUF1573 domain-containing protein [Cyclobacteriaceae bacterium]